MSMPRVKPLTREQEPEVVRRAQAGDKAARDLLVLANQGLAYKLAMDYARACNLPVEDLFHYAVIGAMKAIDKFDLSRGMRFSTYAVGWMWAFVTNGIAQNEILMHTGPRATRRRSMNDLAPPAKGQHLRRLDGPAMASGAGGKLTLAEVVPGAGVPADEILAENEWQRQIRGALNWLRRTLTPLEQDILDNRLLDDRSTLKEIADRTLRQNAGGSRPTISRERVRQIETRLIERLRRVLEPFREAIAA